MFGETINKALYNMDVMIRGEEKLEIEVPEHTIKEIIARAKNVNPKSNGILYKTNKDKSVSFYTQKGEQRIFLWTCKDALIIREWDLRIGNCDYLYCMSIPKYEELGNEGGIIMSYTDTGVLDCPLFRPERV